MITNPFDGEPIPALPYLEDVTLEQFNTEIRPAGKPVVMKGVAADWPAVAIGRQSDPRAMSDYLISFDSGAPMSALIGDPKAGGRFFYNDGFTGFNFRRSQAPAKAVLSKMATPRREDDPYLYAGATSTADVFPDFGKDNPMPLVPENVSPLVWVGNPSLVAPHFDMFENIAACAMGTRHFMVYPPDAVGGLYIGPWEHTPAGRECSLVNVEAPDLDAHPRYPEARAKAQLATLEPGDAIYIPPLWWHSVRAREPLNLLVNYWWKEGFDGGSVMGSLAHTLMTIRGLPATERAAWRDLFDHFVFGSDADAEGAHIPEHIRGARSEASPERNAHIRQFVKSHLG